jgi:V/A-type H+-transporting ATPase subunit I
MIVKMRHLDLVCIASEKTAALERLRELGAVHLDLSAASGAPVVAAKGDAASAEKAVRLILKARGKSDDFDIHERSVEEVLSIDADRETLKAAKEELEREIRAYEQYGDFDPALAKNLLEKVDCLRDYVDLPERLPEISLGKMHEKLERIDNRIRIDCDKLAGCDEKAILRRFPVLADKIAFEAAKEIAGEKGELAFVSGWLPETQVEVLKSAALQNAWGYLLREPAEGEIPPTLVEPPKMFRPMKALFSGLGIAPAYTEADVSVPFMCYFSLFFAMLVGDGAYGAIFLAGTLAMRKKLPKSWFVLLTVFSSATVLWGVLSNTWFGAAIPWLADIPTVKWLADPSYHNMMLLCFTIGVSHLMLARVWNGVCKAPDSTCVAEFGWAGILLFMYLVTNSIVGIFPGIPQWGFWVLGVSIVAVFGFSVKPSELKTRGAELGMLPLNIMSALGDIISYVRLFAVGLASVKVAENFNSMATGLVSSENAIWLNAVMSVAMVAILVVGHALNLAMAGLSILVHAVRLNTLEFSNHKGVSWSGREYKPFRRTTN